MSLTFAADSSANLLSHGDLHIVPMKIITDTREFIDDPALDLGEMLSFLSAYKGRSGTSCPNTGDWLDALEGAPESIIVTITSNLSGAYNSAMQAKQVLEETGARVAVLDSLSTGPEMVLILEKLRDLKALGLSFEEAEAAARDYMTHTHLLFSLASIHNLARNGRVNPIIAKAIGLLGIRLVGKASDQGTLQPMHKCRGEKKALQTLWEEMVRMGYQGGKVRIAHCENEAGAAELRDVILAVHPHASVELHPCTGLCGFYAEAGGLLVGFEDII